MPKHDRTKLGEATSITLKTCEQTQLLQIAKYLKKNPSKFTAKDELIAIILVSLKKRKNRFGTNDWFDFNTNKIYTQSSMFSSSTMFSTPKVQKSTITKTASSVAVTDSINHQKRKFKSSNWNTDEDNGILVIIDKCNKSKIINSLFD